MGQREMTSKATFDPQLLTSAAFEKARYQRRWLIESILLPDQPAVVGGPMKCMKTSLIADMAISLGTGTPFLNHFKVPKATRAAVFSGESGAASLQETARRISESKKTKLRAANVLWSFDLPRLGRKPDLERLHTVLKQNEVAVAFIDPLYLCLLDGASSASACNLFDVGPLLRRAATVCLTAGATPVLVHHAVKSVAGDHKGHPLGLEQLAFAGIGEFARQWLLLSRLEPYRSGSGEHRLLMKVEGSAGHSGCWQVEVAEGVLDDDFGGKKWNIRVCPFRAGRAM